MKITFDPAKRDRTLRERGLDFGWAVEVFCRPTFSNSPDDRHDYGEIRIDYGRLSCVVEWWSSCWTPRGE